MDRALLHRSTYLMKRSLVALLTTLSFLSTVVACATGDDAQSLLRAEPSDVPSGLPALDGAAGQDGAVVASLDVSVDGDGGAADGAPVAADLPQVQSVTPNEALAGSLGPLVAVSGTGFLPASAIEIEGHVVPTTYVSDRELRATVPTSVVSLGGTKSVSVTTPGHGRSGALTFTVRFPAPTLTTVTPSSVPVGSPNVSVTLQGTGLVTGTKVLLDGSDIASTPGTGTSIGITLPAAKLTQSGSMLLALVNPAPGGGASSAIAFTISNPAVTLTALSPSTVLAGSQATLALTLTGTGFTQVSKVLFNGAALVTTYSSPTQLLATLLPTAFPLPGDYPVAVSQPPPGGGVSAPLPFHVINPVPTLATLSTDHATAGAPALSLTVSGAGFSGLSQVLFDGVGVSTTFQTATSLQATLPAAKLAVAGPIAVSVLTPAPGGGTSTGLTFSVLPITCDTTGVNYPLVPGPGATITLNYGAHGPSPTFKFATPLAAGPPSDPSLSTCSVSSLETTAPQYFAANVVQNNTGAPLYLSTYAICSAHVFAFISTYKGSVIPTTDAARMQCFGNVAYGNNHATTGGPGHFGSPSSNGSEFCPGLTRANGGAILLQPCEKAVVEIQPYHYGAYDLALQLHVSVD